jgi:hypothetical protein
VLGADGKPITPPLCSPELLPERAFIDGLADRTGAMAMVAQL